MTAAHDEVDKATEAKVAAESKLEKLEDKEKEAKELVKSAAAKPAPKKSSGKTKPSVAKWKELISNEQFDLVSITVGANTFPLRDEQIVELKG